MTKIRVNNNSIQYVLQKESDTAWLAEQLARLISAPLWVELIGNLGVGKTTLTRYTLQALGHQGSVKSPTYTLVEPYKVALGNFYHFDLYRLSDAEELEYLGIRDYLLPDSIGFVEWPSKGEGFLPSMDLTIKIEMDAEKRIFTFTANNQKGEKLVSELSPEIDKKSNAKIN